jgi:hypothetical protein
VLKSYFASIISEKGRISEPDPHLRLKDPDPGGPKTCGSGIRNGQKVRIRIRDEKPGSYFLELRNHSLGFKYLKGLSHEIDFKNFDKKLHNLA